jgi:hypothetical protein
MEQIAVALGGKPVPTPGKGDSLPNAKPVDPIESEFRKVMDEYDALTLRLAKTRVGRVLATFPADRGWGDAELQIEFSSTDKTRIEQARKLLTLRGHIRDQAQKAESSLAQRTAYLRTKATSKKEELLDDIDNLIRKSELDVKFRTAALRSIIDDLKTLADEIDPPAKEGSARKPGS